MRARKRTRRCMHTYLRGGLVYAFLLCVFIARPKRNGRRTMRTRPRRKEYACCLGDANIRIKVATTQQRKKIKIKTGKYTYLRSGRKLGATHKRPGEWVSVVCAANRLRKRVQARPLLFYFHGVRPSVRSLSV